MTSGRLAGAVLRRVRLMLDRFEPGALRAIKRSNAMDSVRSFEFSHLVFVCQGNINRSAFAEAYARSVFPPAMSISSCGLHTKVHRPSPPQSVAVAADLGVDLGRHRSRSPLDVPSEKTLFVGFEEHHLAPWKQADVDDSRTVLIGVFGSDARAPLYLPDPYRQSAEFTLSVFRDIRQCVNGLFRHVDASSEGTWRIA
jgi:protein-tyrosine phosphatase